MKKTILLVLIFIITQSLYSQEQDKSSESKKLEEEIEVLRKKAKEEMKDYRERLGNETPSEQLEKNSKDSTKVFSKEKLKDKIYTKGKKVSEMIANGMRKRDAIAAKSYKKVAVGVNFGIIGGGLEVAYNINPHINVVGFYDYFRLKLGRIVDNFDFKDVVEDALKLDGNKPTVVVKGDKVVVNNIINRTDNITFKNVFLGQDLVFGTRTVANGSAEATFYNKVAGLKFEYLPFKASSFKLSFGAGYFVNDLLENQFDVSLSLSTDIPDLSKLSGNPLLILDFISNPNNYPKKPIGFKTEGNIKMNIKRKSSFAPYFGIGFGRAVPRSRVGFGFEMGAYYVGGYELEYEISESLKQQSIENFISGFTKSITNTIGLDNLSSNFTFDQKEFDYEKEFDDNVKEVRSNFEDIPGLAPRIMMSIRVKI